MATIFTYKTLFQGFLLTTGDTLYTCPADTQTIVREVRVSNVDQSDQYLLYMNDAGINSDFIVQPETIVHEKDIDDHSVYWPLQPTEFIYGACAFADTNLSIAIFGVEITEE